MDEVYSPYINWTDFGLFGSFILLVALYLTKLWSASSVFKPKHPPIYHGWIPWLGCALEFGKSPLLFINEKQKEMGPVFTLKVAGEYMTILTDPKDIQQFFQSPCLDFQKAVQTSVQNVAAVTKESFFKYHSGIHDVVKGKLASSQLGNMSHTLYTKFQQQLSRLPSQGKTELNVLIRQLLYKPVIHSLFGNGALNIDTEEQYSSLQKNFIKFDEQFEYAAKLPAFLLQDWSKSRSYLLKLFKDVIKSEKMKPDNNSQHNKVLFQNLLENVDEKHSANYSLLLLWAALANSVPITFWTLAFIISNKDVYNKVRREIDAVFPSVRTSMSDEDIKKVPYIKCCLLETIRLRSPGLVPRYTLQPFQIREYTVPAGTRVFASPFWGHRNADYYSEPDNFIPERWNIKDVERNIFPEHFFPFGGGRYQCPGRWFGLMEMQIFIVMFLKQFRLTANQPVPSPSYLHVVGTQQPMGAFTVEFKRQ